MEDYGLDKLSDEILLHIFKHLGYVDVLAIQNVCQKFQRLASDRHVGRKVYCDWWSSGTNQQLQSFLKHHSKSVEILNIHQCYWLKSDMLRNHLIQCSNLLEADLCGVQVSPKILANFLSRATRLKSLGWLDMCKDAAMASAFDSYFDEKSRKTLQQLKKLELVFGGGLEHQSLLPLCKDLETLQIDAIWTNKDAKSYFLKVKELEISGLRQLYISRIYTVLYRSLGCVNLVCGMARNGKLKGPLDVLVMVSGCSRLSPNSAKSLKPYLSSLHTFYCDMIHIESRLMNSKSTFQNKKYIKIKAAKIGAEDLSDIAECSPELEGLSLQRCESALSSNGVYDDSGLHAISEHCKGLTKLNLSGCDFSQIKGMSADNSKDLASIIGNMKGMISLSISPRMFLQPSSIRSAEISNQGVFTLTGLTKKTRVSLATESCTTADMDSGLLSDIVNGCPDLEEFELMSLVYLINSHPYYYYQYGLPNGPNDLKPDSNIRDDDLASISRWQKLCKLTLAWLPGIKHGRSLVTIATNCEQLTSLSLAAIGSSAFCVYSKALTEALPHCHNLKDMRLEQRDFNATAIFWSALTQCHKLQRLCLISPRGSIQFRGLEDLFLACKEFVVCYLKCNETATECKTVETRIRTRYSEKSPALSLAILPAIADDADFYQRIPKIHLEGFVLFQSRVMESPAPSIIHPVYH
ncbi:F-box/LRR-repeat protein 18-like [Ptychodera flava]|uniref:F-box/LRR-repeat protein 18-like n=1 Tax=Ptychodera flava TaxID=63121 RepID=UPI00396A62A5